MNKSYAHSMVNSPHPLGRTLEHDPRSRNFEHPVRKAARPRNVVHTLSALCLDQGTLGSCHDPETEILTRQGWLPFPDLTIDNEVATVDPVTFELLFERPAEVIAKRYRGPMYSVAAHGKNFCVTGDHRMLVRKWDEGARTLASDYAFTPMAEIGWYAGLMTQVRQTVPRVTYTIPGIPAYKRTNQRVELTVPASSWLKFLGIYLAEGTMAPRRKDPNRIQIAAVKDREKRFIRQVLNELGVHGTECVDRFWINNARIYRHLEALGLKGVHAANKFVPRFVFELDSADIDYLLQGHREGDGSFQNDTWTHHTSSPQLADDIQELAFLAGHKTGRSIRAPRSSTMRDGRVVTGRSHEYAVRVLKGVQLSIERKREVSVDEYDGMVYCANVPTHHTLVTRRQGCILISGNCEGQTAVEFLNCAKAQRNRAAFNAQAERPRTHYLDEPLAVSLYAAATMLDNDEVPGVYPPTDTGTSGVGIAKALQQFGGLRQYNWTFTWDAFLAALQTQPVMLGTNWYSSMMNADSHGVVSISPSDHDPAGGHAYLAIAVDYRQQRIGCQNHWTANWGTTIGGHPGRFWLSFTTAQRLLGEQGDSLVPVLL